MHKQLVLVAVVLFLVLVLVYTVIMLTLARPVLDTAITALADTVQYIVYSTELLLFLMAVFLVMYIVIKLYDLWTDAPHLKPGRDGTFPIVRLAKDKYIDVAALRRIEDEPGGGDVGEQPSGDVGVPVVSFAPGMVVPGKGAGHGIIIGATGSGKSVASYNVINAITSKFPNAANLSIAPREG